MWLPMVLRHREGRGHIPGYNAHSFISKTREVLRKTNSFIHSESEQKIMNERVDAQVVYLNVYMFFNLEETKAKALFRHDDSLLCDSKRSLKIQKHSKVFE